VLDAAIIGSAQAI
jgi:hypothetical protein